MGLIYYTIYKNIDKWRGLYLSAHKRLDDIHRCNKEWCEISGKAIYDASIGYFYTWCMCNELRDHKTTHNAFATRADEYFDVVNDAILEYPWVFDVVHYCIDRINPVMISNPGPGYAAISNKCRSSMIEQFTPIEEMHFKKRPDCSGICHYSSSMIDKAIFERRCALERMPNDGSTSMREAAAELYGMVSAIRLMHEIGLDDYSKPVYFMFASRIASIVDDAAAEDLGQIERLTGFDIYLKRVDDMYYGLLDELSDDKFIEEDVEALKRNLEEKLEYERSLGYVG